MPVDFQSIHQQVRQWGEQAPARSRDLQQRSDTALRQLETLAHSGEDLRRWVEQAVDKNAALRCAVPAGEPLDTRHASAAVTTCATLLAADGSQVIPNPHAQIEFGVINLGVFEMYPAQAATPHERVVSSLLTRDEMYTENGLITEDRISLLRDLRERQYLAFLAGQAQAPVVTLTDGPLELFRERVNKDTPDFEKSFRNYLEALRQLAQAGVIAAGYVDKPRSDLVVRLLELSLLPDDRLERAGRERTLVGVRDASLFRFLEPGERSGVFAIQSLSAASYTDELKLHFFYLNVGGPSKPWLARVEVPAWVADDPAALDLLQAVLLAQARQMGSRPYPYALHRAHEVAVISAAEGQQLEQMLVGEAFRRGISIGEKSNKQAHKDLQGRTRHTL